MNMVEFKNCAISVKTNGQLLINKYKSIILILTNIYNIIQNKQLANAKYISDLIERYNVLIETITTNCIELSDRALKYADNFSNNLEEFASRINELLRNIDSQSVKQNIETLDIESL